eukprot:GHVS01004755.1.p1 GENE.GHVS01004755.1~~GHVS01004755.1.p1  ORF type:complete len:572 (+),score=83.29 GHVS01004755.1:148-1863(+)
MYGETYRSRNIDFVDSYEDVAFEGATDLEYLALLCPNRPIVLLSDCLTDTSSSSSTASTTSSPQKTNLIEQCDDDHLTSLLSSLQPPSSPIAFPPSFLPAVASPTNPSNNKSAVPFFHQHNKKTHPPLPPTPFSAGTMTRHHFTSGVKFGCSSLSSTLSGISNSSLSTSISELEGDASPLPYSPQSLSSPISSFPSPCSPYVGQSSISFTSCQRTVTTRTYQQSEDTTTCDKNNLNSNLTDTTTGQQNARHYIEQAADVVKVESTKSEQMVIVVVKSTVGDNCSEQQCVEDRSSSKRSVVTTSSCESRSVAVDGGTMTSVNYETESGASCVTWREDSSGEMITAASIQDEERHEKYDEVMVLYESPSDEQLLPSYVDRDLMIDCSQLTNLSKGLSRCAAADSPSEYLLLSRLAVGKWETLLQRSNPLDPLFKSFGIAYIKRIVVDRLSIPVTITLQGEDSVLDMLVHLPMGNRHMRWALDGSSTLEEDPDCGTWTGYIRCCELRLPWVSDGAPFRALQQVRTHAKIGEVHETRAIVPDSKFGRVLYLNYTLFPKSRPASPLHVVRILKPIL